EGHMATFVGMLTVSRSFRSDARHEYLTRLHCNLVGGWVETGRFPNDEKALRTIVEGVCYRNAEAYFGF
ncbi:MAG: glucuronate isomerase, partial [Clostridia bacterium]|nr:glucuronate isomerase [Clostridia bacterium]